MQSMTLKLRAAACVLVAASAVGGCNDKSKPDFEAESERLKAYIVSEAPKGAQRLDTDFDGKVRLLGYEISPSGAVTPGQRMTLTLFWQATKPVEPGYRLFTHVLDGSGERIENLDDEGPLREPREGRPSLPPEAWKPGKVYVDELRFRVPKKLKTDKLEVVAGVVRKEERLNVVSGEKDGAGAAKVVSIAVEQAQATKGRTNAVDAIKLTPKQKVVIDGKLDEESWKSATELGLGDPKAAKGNPVPEIKATVKVLWSDSGFYVGFDVLDPNVTREFEGGKEARVTQEDAVEIVVDPEGEDNKDYYELQVSAANGLFDTRFDAFKSPAGDGVWGHQDWSSQAKSAVSVRGTLAKGGDKSEDKDEGYSVELFVPWKALSTTGNRPAPNLGDVWRMNFHAIEGAGTLAWSPVYGQSFHRVERFGRVVWRDGSEKDAALAGAGGATAAPSLSGTPAAGPSAAGAAKASKGGAAAAAPQGAAAAKAPAAVQPAAVKPAVAPASSK